MMRYLIISIRVIWLILSLTILFASLFRFSQLDSSHDVSELTSVMTYGMILISFPTGIVFAIVLFFLVLISNIIFPTIDNKYLSAVIIWGWFLFGGYIQWFFLMDKIINKSKLL